MKVLITGGAGFIGFHTAEKFLSEGWEIVTVDNYNNYYDPNLKFARTEKMSDGNAEKLDIQDYDDINESIRENKPDLVIHLAASAGVRYSMEHPQEYIDNNFCCACSILL